MTEIDWADSSRTAVLLPRVLDLIADSGELQTVQPIRVEQYPNFFKVVLAEFDNGSSLRLHLFPRPGVGSRHSHRWVFGSRMLAGRLRHTLFEEDEVYARRPTTNKPIVMCRDEIPRTGYVLWPTQVHSIEALEPSLTLVARGPAVRDTRFVDVQGVEHGWARRYNRPDKIPAGVEPSAEQRSLVWRDVERLLRCSP